MQNLLNPWILARLVSGATVLTLVALGCFVAAKVLRYFRVGQTHEGQLALERRADLVATLVQGALMLGILHLAFTPLIADRLSRSLQGAMCGYGVFAASPFGFLALFTTAAAALSCALWLALHRYDLHLPTPVLTRVKFQALFVVAGLCALDTLYTARFLFGLDLHVISSCCSSTLDGDASPGLYGASFGPPYALASVGGVGALLAIGASLLGALRASAPFTYGATLLCAVAAAAALPAIAGFVAPHVYEVPHHTCIFCLLRWDEGGLGWPLMGSLFVALATGLALGVVEAVKKPSGAPSVGKAMQRRLGFASAAAWTFALLLGAWPYVHYLMLTGGIPLFGESS